LDEALEFNSAALDSLREPLEAGRVSISRSAEVAVFPARFQLVLAANPCPCGLLGVPDRDCRCSIQSIRRYSNRLSGPILDRIDIRLAVRPVGIAAAAGLGASAESSEGAASKVFLARVAARERLEPVGYQLNAHLPGPVLRKRFKPGKSALTDLDRMVSTGRSSMRGYDRCLRLAWTLADLDGATIPTREHIQRAVALRGSDELTVA
jgi:magnesium chelatase family protein